MAGSEAGKLAVRSLSRRPVETVLLVIGIALGIGTTAGGVSMVAELDRRGQELISSTAYREIVVSTRENAEDMEVPAYRNESTEAVILTGEDLAARDASPDVQYAYTLANRRVRIANFEVQQAQFTGPGGGAGAAVRIDRFAPPSEGAPAGEAVPGAEGSTTRAARIQDGARAEEVPPPELSPEQLAELFRMPEYEGPTPVLEEIFAVEITPEFFSAYEIEPAQGSLFTQQEIDEQRPVAVVGATLGRTLFEDGIALGREILVGRTLYEIIGVAEETGTRYDEAAFYPSFTTGMTGSNVAVMMRAFGAGATLRFTVHDAGRLAEARSQLAHYFDTLYGTGAVVVRTPGTEAEETIDRNSRLVTIILFLAVAGLLIAAVNVSNILYSRAMRRRKSVGILKALGATSRKVFVLFLEEAITIGTIGAVLGIGVSVAFTRLLGTSYAAQAVVTFPMIAGAVGAFAITLALTIIPALQASSIPPAEALRYE
jgi:hypothetical protein